jgi:ADP-ribosylglycohydrolase
MHHGPTLRARSRGALHGAALGDALRRPLEGASARDLRASGGVEARAASDDPLGYSDDTEMLLGVGESLLRRDGVDPYHHPFLRNQR